MAKNALFDKKRKRQIKEALKRGDASVFRRGRQSPAAPQAADDEKTSPAPMVPAEDEQDYITHAIRPGERRIDHELVQAVRLGDVERVMDAINNGADVNAECTVCHAIRPKKGDCQSFFKTTPLGAAENLGLKEIASILKRAGAVEKKKW